MSAAPPQSMGYATGSGGTNADIFVLWFETFHEHNKSIHGLQVTDGHHSHQTMDAKLSVYTWPMLLWSLILLVQSITQTKFKCIDYKIKL